ncbi:MAG: hypothetical protein HXY48_09370 [Ignavibacteriaceae bacterium]|jgi:hypothetical protein|nr:hypothetical protein [Ignavibacteriaceae bacterium]
MKIFFVLILFTVSFYPQDRTINLRGYDIELGMTMEQVWEKLKSGFNVIEDEDSSFYISDKNSEPVGVIKFKNEVAVKIIKDWGTKSKSNVGQVFKTLWNILKQYEKNLDATKIIPIETFTQKGSNFAIQIYLAENRYLEITIQLSVTILEVLEEPKI